VGARRCDATARHTVTARSVTIRPCLEGGFESWLQRECATATIASTSLLRREGWKINHKRVYRLYRMEGLSMRLKRPRRHVMAAHRQNRPAAGAINENWSMDFVSDALFDGRRIRALTVVDDFSRESLAIEVGQSITGEQVVSVMNRLTAVRGAPQRIRVDNGPEFVSRALDQWAYLNQVTLDFSRPGKPTDTPW